MINMNMFLVDFNSLSVIWYMAGYAATFYTFSSAFDIFTLSCKRFMAYVKEPPQLIINFAKR